MTHASEPIDPAQAKALRAFGDALAEGQSNPTTNDVEHTMLRTQRTLGADRLAASAMPDSLKHTIWENLMHAQTATSDLHMPPGPRTSHMAAVPSSRRQRQRVIPALSHTGSSYHPHNSRVVRAVMRWQPAVSLAVVIAFLVGLVGIAYQRGILHEPSPSQTPARNASQVMYDGDDASTFPEVPAQCATNGPVESDAFYTDMSIGNLPRPAYTPVQAVTPEVGERIQETYLRFARCQYESTENYPYPEATPTSYSDVLSPLALSYFSDRARLVMLYPELDATQQAHIDDQQCAAIGLIGAGFPLPINQPIDYALISSTVDNLPLVTTLAFAPSDVYLLPDGRFGAIMGSVSAAAFVDPTAATEDDHLRFVAFVEQNGRYLIDEEFVVFAGGSEQVANPYFPKACG